MPYMERSSGSPILCSGLVSLVICNRKSGVLNVEKWEISEHQKVLWIALSLQRYCQ